MTRVYFSHSPEKIDVSTGIGQVVVAQFKHLPSMGIEIVNHPDNAQVIACHIARGNLPRVDVLHCHGLYFDDIFHYPYQGWHNAANREIASAARGSVAVTTPSEWVAYPFRRDMRINPVVIGHGVDLADWEPGQKSDFILYNKSRESDVCTSMPALKLSEAGFNVISTTIPPKEKPNDHFMVTGTMPHTEMKRFIEMAQIYLSTTMETFGIGIIEALACGVPVLGYADGGILDIIQHKQNGYLVPRGDIEALKEGVAYIRGHLADMSEAARESSRRYDWKNIMQSYANLYHSVAKAPVETEATIVITNYNYAHWIGDAVVSALNQSKPPAEIIIVDDGSTDNSRQVIDSIISKYSGGATKIGKIYQNNQGVAAARNHGIAAVKTPFVTCLDADDKLAPYFVEMLSGALSRERGLGIAYSGLEMISGKGESSGSSDWPPEFSWKLMAEVGNPPRNCIPSGCMFRKEMWVRAGPYRQEYAPGEDTEFWVRGLSVGYDALRVTRDPLFVYRAHEGSASREKQYIAIDDRKPWMRDKVFPLGAPSKENFPINSYSAPEISVIIPVGSGHEEFVVDAIDSVLGQDFRQWELILVDDTGRTDEWLPRHLNFCKVIKTPGKSGAGHARNLGIDNASAPYLFFLDADDYLTNNALADMLHLAKAHPCLYVYGDYMIAERGKITKHEAKEYDQTQWKMQHSVSVLMLTSQAKTLRFDETMPSWEDWDFFIRAAISGYCGIHLNSITMVYRLHSGTRRMKVMEPDGKGINPTGNEILKMFDTKYSPYFSGGTKMGSCCGDGGTELIRAKEQIMRTENRMQGVREDMPVTNSQGRVRMQYTGDKTGGVAYTINNRRYIGGNNPQDRFIDALPEDVDALIQRGVWVVVKMPAAAMNESVNASSPRPVANSVDEIAIRLAGIQQRSHPDNGPRQSEMNFFNPDQLKPQSKSQVQAPPPPSQPVSQPVQRQDASQEAPQNGAMTEGQKTQKANADMEWAKQQLENRGSDPIFDLLQGLEKKGVPAQKVFETVKEAQARKAEKARQVAAPAVEQFQAQTSAEAQPQAPADNLVKVAESSKKKASTTKKATKKAPADANTDKPAAK
jgi:glycosyltransferase involved in cell wall biosynthesis